MGKRGSVRHILALLAVALVAPACGGGGGGKSVPGTVIVTLTSAATTSEDGVTQATFTVVLGKKPKKTVTIAYASDATDEGVPDGTGTLTFTTTNWNLPQTITVTGVNDDLDDSDAPYNIVLSPCVSLDKSYNGVDPADVALTNTDDDTAGFNFQNILGLTTTESGGQATFTVRLNSQPTTDVTLTLSSDNTNIGTVSPTTLTFTAAAGGANGWDQLHTVTLTGVDDAPPVADGSHTWHVDFAAATGGGAGYNGVTPASITVSNSDNDQPGITVNPSTGLVTNESGGTDTFTVVLNSLPSGDVTVTVTSQDTTAGLVSTAASPTPASTKTLTFTTLNWNVTQTVTLHGQNDAQPAVSAAVPYIVRLDPASVADAGYDALANIDVSATNQDDDVAGITVTPLTGLVTTEAGGQATFTVQLDTIPSGTVVLTVTSNNTAEGTVDQATLTFAADSTALNPQTVTLTGVQDSSIDGDFPYTITIAVDQTNTLDSNYDPIADKTVNATNNDDDQPGFNLSANANSLSTSENGTTDSFTVALKSIPANPVTINFAVTVAPGEVSVTASLNFAADATALNAQTVTVTGLNDGGIDGPIDFTITGTASSTDTNYNNLTLTATGTNADNDFLYPPGSGPYVSQPAVTGIPVGANGTWNAKSTQEPCVIKIGSTYHMWFEGLNAAGQKHEQIGYASSTDGKTWTINANPVLTHSGTTGTFDRNGAGDPSVVYDGATYHMWYAGRENAATKNKIGYATASNPDGPWTRQNGGNSVLTSSATAFESVGVSGPAVVKDGATYHMFYSGLDGSGVYRIGHATSTDGINWSKTAGPVLNTGATGEWDAFAAKLCGVFIEGADLKMLYVGTDVSGPSGRQRIGYATATLAAPTAWTKFANNPTMSSTAGTFDERNLWSPWVIKDPDDGIYKMWYGGENNAGTIRIGYAEIP